MSNEITVRSPIAEIEETQSLVRELLKTKHYQKLGEVGIFAVVQKAKSIGMNPLDALNGGIYYLPNGVLEMSAMTMNMLIRSAGHSITKDEKSTHTVCILRGKRKDNGDTWTASFSIDDAKKANIYKNTWLSYPEDMLFARALSRLARQLFPDVIKGCYVAGEVEVSEYKESPHTQHSPTFDIQVTESKNEEVDTISRHQLKELLEIIASCPPAYQDKIMKYAKKKYDGLENLPASSYDATLDSIIANSLKQEAVEEAAEIAQSE